MKSGTPFTVALLLGPLVFGLCPTAHAAYEIKRGDSLTSIAKAKYGDMDKWKEIFELNKAQIRDPHWIYPGQRLRLMPEEKLTLVASNDPLPKVRKRSQEWRLLPKQHWERFVFSKDPYIDPTGFDRRSNVGKRFSNQTITPMTIAPDRIPIAGEITGSRSDYSQLTLGETALIRADDPIQVGSIYSVTSGPEKLSSSRDGRVGFAYSILGKMKIIGVRDGMFIGTVVAIYYPIERGNLLIPDVSPIPIPAPKECPSPLNASAMVPKILQKSLNGPLKFIFLDVGNQDGIKPGMIFRHYLNTDPYTHSKFPTRDFMIESEVIVLSAQEQFSIGMILQSRSGIRHEDELVGLIDLKDFDRNQGLQSVIQDHATPTMDDLDLLDNTDGLGEKEIQELKQLESWSKQSPSAGTGAGLPEEEFKREVVTPNPKTAPEIGEEVAPDDKSGTGIPSTPPTAPETEPKEPAKTEPAKSEPALKETPSDVPKPAPSPTPQNENEIQPESVAPPPSIDSALDGAPVTP
jgi:hypothetical protein